MSRSSRAPLRALTSACACVAFGLAAASTASAAVTCTYDSATKTATVSMPAGGDTTTIAQTPAGAITVGGAACGAATVANTTRVLVDGATGTQQVTVSLAGGTLNTTSGTEPEINARLGSGTDYLRVTGSSAIDTIRAGTLGINLNSDTDLDLVSSGVDDLVISGLAADDVLSGDGGFGTGSATTRSGIDWLGGAGADTITGGASSDDLRGDADVQFGPAVAGGAADKLTGGTGGDTLRGQTGDDTVAGGEDNDLSYFDVGNDRYTGGPGSDSFYPDSGAGGLSDGADSIAGNSGTDYVNLANRTQNLRITLDNLLSGTPAVGNDGADTNADGVADEGDDIRADIEDIDTGTGNDVVTADTTLANSANAVNRLYLGGGNDDGKGGEGGDTLDGGAGDDTLAGGPGNDGMYGAAGHDSLTGSDGSDSMRGGADSDPVVDGGAGNDNFPQETNPDGADVITGGTGKDELYIQRTSNIRVSLDNIANDGSDVDQDGTASDDEADNVRADVETIYSGSGNDVLNANVSAANTLGAENTFYSGNGNDTLRGGAGDDLLDASAGTDSLDGGVGEDAMYGGAGLDTFLAQDGYYDRLDGGFGDGVNDVVTADAFDDQIYLP